MGLAFYDCFGYKTEMFWQGRNSALRSTFATERARLGIVRELEAVYNGPVPEPTLRAAHLGSALAALRIRAGAETSFFAAMVKGQIATIRRRRADGSHYPALLDDLALYRRQFRAWRRFAASLDERRSPDAEGRDCLLDGSPIART